MEVAGPLGTPLGLALKSGLSQGSTSFSLGKVMDETAQLNWLSLKAGLSSLDS